MASAATDGDSLLRLLGEGADEDAVKDSLAQLARGAEPELDPDDEDKLTDWVTVNELGLEYGFEDEAYVRAWDPGERRNGRLLLTQLYFYGDTAKTQPFPYPLPFGLTLTDDRPAVRRKMSALSTQFRGYIRDAWILPTFEVTAAYAAKSGLLQSVLCYIPYAPWPPLPDQDAIAAAFTPDVFIGLFGLRWSNVGLRAHLAQLGYEAALPGVRAEHVADLRERGLELTFVPGAKVKAAEPGFPDVMTFAGVTFYANRQLDAREWCGSLPFALTFMDSQGEMRAKVDPVAGKPVEARDDDLTGLARWLLDGYEMTVIYSNVWNRILRVMIKAAGP